MLRLRARAAAARQRLPLGHRRDRVTRAEHAAASNSVDRSERLFSEPDARRQSSGTPRGMAKGPRRVGWKEAVREVDG